MAKKNKISDQELKALTTAIKNRYDIDFTHYEVKPLMRRFTRLITRNKINSGLDLWRMILNDRDFFMKCLDQLTVNLTEMFRNPEIWIKLNEDVLNEYKGKARIDIWHAGCSSGEEVYTMAIVLKEKGLLTKSKTLATDISSSMLNKGTLGEYSIILFQKYAQSYKTYYSGSIGLEKSFNIKAKVAAIKPEFKQHNTFKYHNLATDDMDQKFDIIFCRNVMLYFNNTLREKVIKLFHKSLNPGGYLIVGYYDRLPGYALEIFNIYDNKARIYQKKDV